MSQRRKPQHVARTTQTTVVDKPGVQRPRNLTTVFLPCPAVYRGTCRCISITWPCESCRSVLTYSSDDGCFYCKCGKALAGSFGFRCGEDSATDPAFEKFDDDDLVHLLHIMKTSKEYNILIIGQTGVGKSTWINAFANYISNSTLERAEADPNIVYTIPAYYNFGENRRVFIGNETEEEQLKNTPAGQSVTQLTATYVFKYRDVAIRLIDTPGIGDTRGLDFDQKNMQNILDYLSNFDELHGICVLLKPDEARLTIELQYCMKELFRQLHVDACKNIVFCLTHSRTTEFEPGKTLSTLTPFINDCKMPVKVDPDKTVYCVDNEGVEFLYGVKKGLQFKDSVRKQRRKSWKKSASQTGKLVEYVLALPPHRLKETVSLNDTRRVVRTLCRGPLVDVSALIEANIKRLENLGQRREQPTVVVVQYVMLKMPRLVCHSHECSSRGGCLPGLLLKRVCCAACNAIQPRLCDKIALLSGKCKWCKCHVSSHAWETYCIVMTPRVPDSPPKQPSIANRPAGAEELRGNLESQKLEQMIILETAAKLVYFLGKNSIVTDNDAFVEYLQIQMAVTAEPEQRMALEGLREEYAKHRKDLEDLARCRTASEDLPETADDVKKLIETLYRLQINGPTVRRAMEVISNATAFAVVYQGDKHFQQPIIDDCEDNNPVQSLIVRLSDNSSYDAVL